jgi:hypothetical protein
MLPKFMQGARMNLFFEMLRKGHRCILMVSALTFSVHAQFDGIDSHKLTVKSFVDFGHIVSGWNEYGNEAKGERNLAMVPLNRLNVSAIQDVALKSFDVSVGLSALIWWPYDGGISDDVKQRVMNVKPMVPIARARWQFGDPNIAGGSLMLGTFNYKYNPDARNLGEYLYRSGTYPGFLWSNDGWLLMNRAGNYSHGLLLGLTQLDGHLKHNISLFMETLYFPVGDFSPGYDFSYSSKWITIGGGAVFNHYIPLKPSKLEPKNNANTYVRIDDIVTDNLGVKDTVSYYAPKSEVSNLKLVSPLEPVVQHRWTSKGIKIMGRATLNLGSLLPESIRGPEDLKIFGEVAMLGVKNQPLYYEKPEERMPIMAGINLPTGKILDLFALQLEYYKSPQNDINYFNTQSFPIWKTAFLKDSTDHYVTDAAGMIIPVANHRDDIKWSIYIKKSLGKIMTSYLQIGSDHFRLTDADYKAVSVPLTTKPKDWYYLFRLEFSLR